MNEKRSNLQEEVFICFSLNTLINHYILDYFCNDYCKKSNFTTTNISFRSHYSFFYDLTFHTKFEQYKMKLERDYKRLKLNIHDMIYSLSFQNSKNISCQVFFYFLVVKRLHATKYQLLLKIIFFVSSIFCSFLRAFLYLLYFLR